MADLFMHFSRFGGKTVRGLDSVTPQRGEHSLSVRLIMISFDFKLLRGAA
jgi:hypothetical protein